jgi:hypothetical protein
MEATALDRVAGVCKSKLHATPNQESAQSLPSTGLKLSSSTVTLVRLATANTRLHFLRATWDIWGLNP